VNQCPVELAVWRAFRKLWLNSGFSRAAAAQFACQLMWQEQGDINNIIFRQTVCSSVRPSTCRLLALAVLLVRPVTFSCHISLPNAGV